VTLSTGVCGYCVRDPGAWLRWPVRFLAQPGLADTQRGYELVARLRTNCPVVDREASRADIPTFAAIANRRASAAEQLAARIIVPHPAMQGVP